VTGDKTSDDSKQRAYAYSVARKNWWCTTMHGARRFPTQWWNRNLGSRDAGSTTLAGSGRVTGQCDRPGVWRGFFVVFERALLLVLVTPRWNLWDSVYS